MGTHPIFESDFDCLTDFLKCRNKTIRPRFQLKKTKSSKPSLSNWRMKSIHLNRFLLRKSSRRQKCEQNWESRLWLKSRRLLRISENLKRHKKLKLHRASLATTRETPLPLLEIQCQ